MRSIEGDTFKVDTLRTSVSWIATAVVLGASLSAAPVAAQDAGSEDLATLTATSGICNQSTLAADRACRQGAQSDYSLALGTCQNIIDTGKQLACRTQAADDLTSAKHDCGDQKTARDEVCNAIGQQAYNPPIRPADFTTRIDNRYDPMVPGTIFTYKNKTDIITVEVTNATIKLMGVTCRVVRDTDRLKGQIVEDTRDYFAQDIHGNVWYFGEQTAQYDNGLPVGVEGAWQAGVGGAKPGIVMPAPFALGASYRQEFSLGIAEDSARNVAKHQHVHVPFGTFNDAVETFEFSGLEPGSTENKYYAPGVGLVLTVDKQTGEREFLVSIKH